MLSVLTNEGYLPLQHKINNFYIDFLYGGFHTLDFEIPITDSLYPYLIEEASLRGNGNQWIVKKINERSGSKTSSVSAELDLREWKGQYFDHFLTETQSLSYVLEYIKPIGWNVVDAGLVARRLTIDLERVTGLNLLEKCAEYYDVLYEFDVISKTITVIKLVDAGTTRGVYLTDELNLKTLDVKGSSDELITRLIPLGKKDEATGKYLSIESVNQGKNYLDNKDYLDKVIVGWWIDERYTEAQSLKDAAIEKLKVLAIPVRSYTCEVVDIAKVKKGYEFLEISLYDSVALMDRIRKTCVIHRIVKYRVFPDVQTKNVLTLSTVPQQIKSQIKVITGKIDENLAYTKNIKNEILRSVDTNYAKISETYTKGQTETMIQSEITQSQNLIRTEVSEVYLTKNDGQTAIDGLQSTIEQQAGEIDLAVKSLSLPNMIVNSAFTNGKTNWNEIPTDGGLVEFLPNQSGGACYRLSPTVSGGKAEISQDLTINRVMNKIHLSADVMISGNLATWCGIGFYIMYTDGTNSFPVGNITKLERDKWTRIKYSVIPDASKIVKTISPLAYVKSGDIVLHVRKMYCVESNENLPTSLWNDLSASDTITQINMSPGKIKIQASKIDLTGLVTISDLSGIGKTIINADNLTTGTIRGRNIEAAEHIYFGDESANIKMDWFKGPYTGVIISGNKDITFASNSLGFSADTALFVDGHRALDEDITVKNWNASLLKMRFKKGIAWFFQDALWSSGAGFTGNYNGMYIHNGIVQTVNGSEGSHE